MDGGPARHPTPSERGPGSCWRAVREDIAGSAVTFVITWSESSRESSSAGSTAGSFRGLHELARAYRNRTFGFVFLAFWWLVWAWVGLVVGGLCGGG